MRIWTKHQANTLGSVRCLQYYINIFWYFDKNCDNLTDLDGCPVYYLDREVSKFTQNFIKYICHLLIQHKAVSFRINSKVNLGISFAISNLKYYEVKTSWDLFVVERVMRYNDINLSGHMTLFPLISWKC